MNFLALSNVAVGVGIGIAVAIALILVVRMCFVRVTNTGVGPVVNVVNFGRVADPNFRAVMYGRGRDGKPRYFKFVAYGQTAADDKIFPISEQEVLELRPDDGKALIKQAKRDAASPTGPRTWWWGRQELPFRRVSA
ncbi:MAG: hypothetical protein K0S38_957 [Candidatus Paceibacter sp.]|jgi:hypothetical protein|nr:hypothetical protein [Candidatus Paceibacter sp.]